jgi:hypothetical protein
LYNRSRSSSSSSSRSHDNSIDETAIEEGIVIELGDHIITGDMRGEATRIATETATVIANTMEMNMVAIGNEDENENEDGLVNLLNKNILNVGRTVTDTSHIRYHRYNATAKE